MINTKVEIAGLEDVLRTFETAPAEMRKVVRKCMTTASSKTAKSIKARTPKRWRKLVGYGVWTSRRNGMSGARMGYYASKSGRGGAKKNEDRAFDWYKAYWINYGTLMNRYPGHTFKRPVKPKHYAAAKRRRDRVGISPRLFFENATNGWESTYVAAFSAAMDKYHDQAFNK